jgi:hypothetical protein
MEAPMTRIPHILALLALTACVDTPDPVVDTPAYPFVGTWDCGVADFTFTNTTYNNGSETLPIESVVPRANSFVLGLPDGNSVSLSMDGADRMQWLSGTTGDTFDCTRL